MRRILSSIPVFFASLYGFAQMNPNTNLPSVLPSNPSQYQFLKYDEVPVGKYTGVSNIDIPVYTINAKGLDIPVSLSYHSNGFRVNEEAGWTGLGWTLQGGGSINQVVSGSDDFGYYQHRSLPDFHAIEPNLPAYEESTCVPFYIDGYDGNNAFCTTNVNGNATLDMHYTQGFYDSEPDIFKFSMLNYSGSFLLDWQNNVFICLSNSDYKVECTSYSGTNQAPVTFYITVTDGHKFKFELKEEGEYIVHTSISDTYGGTSTGPDMRVAGERAFRTYQLTEITTSQGDVISYNYSLSDYVVSYPSVSKGLTFYEPTDGSYDFSGIPGFRQYDVNSTILVTKQKYSYLNAITFFGGSINFSTSARTDAVGMKKLDQVAVTSTISPTTTIKTFTFAYDYFQGDTQGTNLNNYFSYYPSGTTSKTTDEVTKRLKLLSVTESGQPAYVFEYNESIPLPQKTSLATDYWGFYNGYVNNNGLFPNIYSFNVERDNVLLQDYENNFKAPNVDYCKAAVLKKITYPTKGYVEFSYELNSFNNYAVPTAQQGTPSSVSISTKPGFTSQKAVIINGGNTIFRGSAFLSTTGCTDPNSYSSCYLKIQHFRKELLTYITTTPTLNSHYTSYGLMYVLGADLDFLDGNPSNPTLYNQYKDTPEAYTYKQATGPTDETLSNLLYNLTEGIAVFTASGGCGVYGSGASSSSSGNISQATLNLTYHDYQPLPAGPYFGAGLRIAATTTYTGPYIPAVKKRFTYENGLLMTPLVYATRSPYQQEAAIPVGENGSCTILSFYGKKFVLSSSSFATLSTSASGSYVGYAKVTEETLPNNYVSGPVVTTTGKTITYYTNAADITAVNLALLDQNANTVMFPPVLANLDNGLVGKEEYYDNAGPLKDVTYSYNADASTICFYGARYALVKVIADHSQCSYTHCSDYQIGAYPIKTRRRSLIGTSVENQYSGGVTLSKTRNFGYDTHAQLNYIKETNSNGELVETYNNYPYNFSSDAVYTGMVSKNVISPIVKSTKNVAGNTISVVKNIYKFIDAVTVGSVYYPSKYVISKNQLSKTSNDTDLEDRVVYYNQDIYGNPTDVSLANGPHICYIWGYKGRYPIAKIENSTYASVNSYAASLQSASENGTLTESSFATLRNGLPTALITTYTYKPLVGIYTVTDPKGNTTNYNYDAFTRLISIKDRYNNDLINYGYNYKP